MIFYYIRHGDPIYNPDGLTPLGYEQADALKYRLCANGFNKIYASSSNRAILTAKPTADLLKKEIETLDWCNEKYAYDELGLKNDEGFYSWCFNHAHIKKLFLSEEVRLLGENWYDHKAFEGTKLKEGMLRIRNNADEFMLSLGCVQAVNGDGGGSSAFLSQRPGEELKINCSPSDGAERPTTHGILVISTAVRASSIWRANRKKA